MKKHIGGVITGSDAYFFLDYIKDKSNDLILITNNIKDEAQLLTDFNFYIKYKKLEHLELICFPNYEVLFYDNTMPNENIISHRIQTLTKLCATNNKQKIIITSLETILFKLSPKNFITKFNYNIKVGDTIDMQLFSNNLLNRGYLRVNKVNEIGDFACRGSIIDVFVFGSKHPIRMDIFDNSIEDIRLFDETKQLSLKKIDKFNILHAQEFNFDKNSRNTFLANHRRLINTDDDIYTKVKNGILPTNIYFYLPLFFQQTSSFFDYLPTNSIIAYQQDLTTTIDDIVNNINSAYNANKNNANKLLSPDDIFIKKNDFLKRLTSFDNVIYSRYKLEGKDNFPANTLPTLTIYNRSIKLLNNFIKNTNDKILIVCDNKYRCHLLSELLADFKPTVVDSFDNPKIIQYGLVIALGRISLGFSVDNLTIIDENTIFGNILSTNKKAKRKNLTNVIKNLSELQNQDLIVHESYGIGKYLGLRTIDIDGIKQDILELEYQNSAKLLVPIDEINLIAKYFGSKNPPLNKLGSKAWSNTKRRILKEMHDIASELLIMYAKREMASSLAIDFDSSDYNLFCSGFPFVETEDQVKAMTDIIEDLQNDKPMDRIICGDVGFGKTELAMRAAFLVANAGCQVAILVPTTILSYQHYQSFIERFADFAINIAEFSRFKTKAQQEQIKQKLKSGHIDIIIGTHKLLQQNINYHNLGLFIIDEEHRFGVKQKENIKNIKNKCNILSMSATPIPRTLSLAFNKLRAISTIATPPIGRTKIQTFVTIFDKKTIVHAVQRELHRGGQIFFLHNNINNIVDIVDMLAELFPNITIKSAHGRMSTKNLEHIMQDFYHQRFEILVSTTIIENGIDIPTANTIIINDANDFGLSQLHQLRGRVGRSNHKAYAYLLIKSFNSINDDAKKRLEAIQNFEEVGSGFNIANRDLEIRGAGDILGKNQSGKISEIGYSLYLDLLTKTIQSIRDNKNISHNDDIKIDLGLPAFIPSSYIFDVHMRLEFYAKIRETNDLELVKAELIDMFGEPPIETKNLFALQELRVLGIEIGVTKINIINNKISIIFAQENNISIDNIMDLIKWQPEYCRLQNNNTLTYCCDSLTDITKINTVKNLLEHIK